MCTPFFTPFSDLTSKSESCGTPFLSNNNKVCTPFFTPFFFNSTSKMKVKVLCLFSNNNRVCTPFFKNGAKNGVHSIIIIE